MAITHVEIAPGQEQLGRRVLLVARRVAPCLETLDPSSEAGKDAIAVLAGVVATYRVLEGGTGIASQGVGSARVSYRDVESAFTSEARESLSALCGAPAKARVPLGSFPVAGIVRDVWPEVDR